MLTLITEVSNYPTNCTRELSCLSTEGMQFSSFKISAWMLLPVFNSLSHMFFQCIKQLSYFLADNNDSLSRTQKYTKLLQILFEIKELVWIDFLRLIYVNSIKYFDSFRICESLRFRINLGYKSLFLEWFHLSLLLYSC